MFLEFEKSNTVENRSDSESIFSEVDIIILMDVWIDTTFVEYERLIFQLIVDIPIGTTCAFVLIDIPFGFYEVELL